MKKKISLEKLEVKSFRTESAYLKGGLKRETGDRPVTLGEDTCVLCYPTWNCA